MSPRILFVVEGKKTEKSHVAKVAQDLFHLAGQEYQISIYGTSIHTLYRLFTSGNYDNLVSYLAERDPDLRFPGLKANEIFSSIYLIFDFDPQTPQFDPEQLLACAEHFQDETRDGKLYLNYPMFESLRDVPSENESDYYALTVPLRGLSSHSYKKTVNARTIFRKPHSGDLLTFIPAEKIPFVIHLNENKYNQICGFAANKPWSETDTPLLLQHQLSLMDERSLVSVINTFILLIKDYNPDLAL